MDNKEIRDILLGRIVQLDEEHWAVAPAGTKFHFYGVKDGAGDVRLFGVTHRSNYYEAEEMESPIAFAAVETALHSMGRPMQLASKPKAKACLYAPNWIAPVLLTLAQDGDGLLLTAYTGRSMLIGQIRCRIALWILERRLPDGIICAEKNRKTAREYKNLVKKKDVSKQTSSAKKEKAASKKKKRSEKSSGKNNT